MTDANRSTPGEVFRSPAPAVPNAPSELLASLRNLFSQSDEENRCRLIAAMFSDLADSLASNSGLGRGSVDPQLATLYSRLQAVAEEKAGLADALAAARVDCAHRTAQFQAEQIRGQEQLKIIEEQRSRLDSQTKERLRIEAELVQKNTALYQAEIERERLTLQLQRGEARAAGTAQTDRLEASRRELLAEVERLRSDLEQLRCDKDGEIERLRSELSRALASGGRESDAVLGRLWQRLAAFKPQLTGGAEAPNVSAAERLVDGFAELVRFADELDKGMRVFLDKYTKYHPSVKVPWEVYAKKEDVIETARQLIAVKDSRPVGLLKMKLRVLYSWCQAAMIGSDSAVESIASELEAQLRGPKGLEADANRKIKDFLREDGHYVFLEHMRELRSRKLAESFGRGG